MVPSGWHFVITLDFDLQRPFQRWLTSALVHSLWILVLMIFSLTPAIHHLNTLRGILHKVTYPVKGFGRFSITLLGFSMASTLAHQVTQRLLPQELYLVASPLTFQRFLTYLLANLHQPLTSLVIIAVHSFSLLRPPLLMPIGHHIMTNQPSASIFSFYRRFCHLWQWGH